MENNHREQIRRKIAKRLKDSGVYQKRRSKGRSEMEKLVNEIAQEIEQENSASLSERREMLIAIMIFLTGAVSGYAIEEYIDPSKHYLVFLSAISCSLASLFLQSEKLAIFKWMFIVAGIGAFCVLTSL